MKRTRTLPLALLATLAACMTTTAAASAESTPLPDIHIALPGETYPLNLGGQLLSKVELQNAAGGVLEGTDVSALLQALELTSLGHAFLELLGVKEAGGENRKCNSLGASEERGEVIFPNAEWHLVYTALSPGERLELGLLWLFTKFTLFCQAGLVRLVVTGPIVSRVNVSKPVLPEGDSTDIEIATHCTARGVQELPYYYNDRLERVTTTLLENFNETHNEPSCEEIPGTLLLTPETGSLATMFSVLY
jgi:hypothetical protein